MNFKWIKYNSAEEFKKDTINDLLKNPYQNSVILGILKRAETLPQDGSVRLAVVRNEDKNILIGCQTLPFQMLYYFVDNIYNEEALNFYIDNVIKSNWDVNGIMSDEKSAVHFAKIYSKKSQKSYINSENLYIYKLNKLAKPILAQGDFRQCSEEDLYYTLLEKCV